MSRTGAQLLTGFARFIGDYWSGTTTSAGATTTLIDTALRRFGEDAIGDWYTRPTGATNQYAIRRITRFATATGTCTLAPGFASATGSAEAYELHRYDPALKFECLDAARLRVFPELARTIYDDTTTADGISRVFPIPSTLRQGPLLVMPETPMTAQVAWNFLTNPDGDSTTGYTASGTTADTIARGDYDRLVPKHGDTVTRLVTAASQAATYTQTVANMTNSITATLAADRLMALCRWVYCTEASKVRLQIIDDAGTGSGSYHGGSGWELLTVERTIAGNNATTLSARIDIASTANASTIYVERGWFYFGRTEQVRDGHYYGALPKRVRRDDATQQVYLDSVPPRGYQLRFIGRETLTALGTVAADQPGNTMEVDEENEQILYAEAAKILFQRLGLNLSDYDDVATRVQFGEDMRREMKKVWAQSVPLAPVKGPWAS